MKDGGRKIRDVGKNIIVRRSRIHGRGVFARKDIPKGAHIIEYVGERITHRESDRRAEVITARHQADSSHGAVYIFNLNKRTDIDGNVPYNKARYINHSCEPNAKAEIDRGRIWIVALKNISKGEEIFYNYGYDLEDYESHACDCRAPKCVGYILAREHWPRLKKKKKRIKRS